MSLEMEARTLELLDLIYLRRLLYLAIKKVKCRTGHTFMHMTPFCHIRNIEKLIKSSVI